MGGNLNVSYTAETKEDVVEFLLQRATDKRHLAERITTQYKRREMLAEATGIEWAAKVLRDSTISNTDQGGSK